MSRAAGSDGGDVLLRHRETPLGDDFPILGVPTRVLASDEGLLEAARTAFGGWAPLAAHPDLLFGEGVRVRLIRHEASGDGPGAEVRYRVPHPGLLIVTTPGSVGVADLEAREVVAYVTGELLADGAHFRHAFLSALTLATVTSRDRIPLHAAALSRGDAALLLHGPSGVGKSSLVLAAAQRGMEILSEDIVYAELERGPRLWGMPGAVHLTEDALRFFPGLEPGRRVVRTGGKTKLSVSLPAGIRAVPLPALRAGTCLLRRGSGPPAVTPATNDEVEAVLTGATESGFDWFAHQAAGASGLVTGRGAWHFDVGSDPHAAAAALEELLGRI